MFSYPIGQITKDDINTLSDNIHKRYTFLTRKQCDYAAREFFLEQRVILSKQNNIPTSVTCGELVELIIAVVVLRFDINNLDDIKKNSINKLYALYHEGIWPALAPESYFLDSDESEIKNIVWLSFVKKLSKDATVRLFCIIKDQLCLKQKLFQDYLMSQMAVRSLKRINHEQNRALLLKYQQYFERLYKSASRWGIGRNLDEDDFKDIIAEKIAELLEDVSKPDFKLTSTLNTYFYTLVKNGVINFVKHGKLYKHVQIEEINEKDEQLYFSEEELKFFENEEIYTQTIIHECRNASDSTQEVMAMAQRGANYRAIGIAAKKTENNVGTIVSRFNKKMRKIIGSIQ